MSNVINIDEARFQPLTELENPNGPFLTFLESIKEGKFSPKAAVYYVEDEDNICYGISRTKKADQIKMLYNLQELLRIIVATYPDPDEEEEVKNEGAE